ncbi:ABC transporter permease [Actinospica sp.]|uniref:ABC transporter permease n=1 Tax=Actinospica sp. TaxID=1872142 RepID=UPI002BE6BFED|nr:ABC transporter permease subunit [Actinospica sp.]HWG27628.1 ABC transporter permease subunit [Actinospica sp.]
MAAPRVFPTSGAWRLRAVRPADVLVLLAFFALAFGLLELVPSLNSPFHPKTAPATVSLDPAEIPYYAVRSLLRMFIGLALSVLFTFVYATAAARLPRAERILLPILDILQSVPVLGFLTVIASTFVALFPGSELGLEFASIFAIFTAMAWNITFAFHASLVGQPRELDEAARVLRLTKWERFWQLDVPSGMIPMIWNGMMSFGGAWFFLTASEAITVNGDSYVLPGMGSYVATASARDNLGAIGWAIAAMIILVIGVNFLFWRPLVAWAERFRMGDSASADRPRSVVLDLIRRSQINEWVARPMHPFGRVLDNATRPFGLAEHPLRKPVLRQRTGDVVFATLVVLAVVFGVWEALAYIHRSVGFGQFGTAFADGALTFARVTVVLIVSTLIWVPVGVWIGMNPRVSRLAQPIVQVAASFPANFLYPFLMALFIALGISLDFGGVVLMAMGAQWYILFNVIAGASTVPNDLRESMRVMGVRGLLRWKVLILPAIFPAYVTGAITAAGGAWNASIVAEFVTYNHRQIAARGLGAYITQASNAGHTANVIVGVIVMSIFVVLVNRFFWRRLYHLAERRFSQ